ncbi:helix-turn-helix domain-containing protein [Pseudomonas gingeri]|uniref:Helix-turn-helix transcriptional regulator n=1 Tax=Pseudomonas gingeri TaxID=117681 RepID=A0A7Y8BIQ8_9PSED|nr:helix-turn-helix transcriptional regulator [Pseudomonas gingeri]NWB45057.1 helix-turn-helix transcriptional regulator [Pseudomonas gingeri]
MNLQIDSGWTSDWGGDAVLPASWEKPEQNPRNATSTINPRLVMPLAALMVTCPATEATQAVCERAVLPVSSGQGAPRRLRFANWIAVAPSPVTIPDLTPSLVEGLRNRFGFSDNSLGEIFGVSRQTVYNWRSKKTTADSPERIRALAESLSRIDDSDAPYIQRAIFYPSADGRLIQDVLTDDGWAAGGQEAVDALVQELAAKAQQLSVRDQKTLARLNKSNPNSMG